MSVSHVRDYLTQFNAATASSSSDVSSATVELAAAR